MSLPTLFNTEPVEREAAGKEGFTHAENVGAQSANDDYKKRDVSKTYYPNFPPNT